MSVPSSARAVAFDVVRRVIDEGAYSNLALRRALERANLSDRDAAFATELAYGTLRRLVPIDRQLEPLLERPLELAPKAPRAALRLGAYQLRYTRVPPHAAVSETVSLVDRRHRGFVNAVLRRSAGEPPREVRGSSDEAVSVRTGLAAWGVRELRRVLPDDEEVEAAAAALGEPGRVSLRVNTCRASIDEVEEALSRAGVPAERGVVHPGSLLIGSGDPTSLPGFADGTFAVQDQASSFVVGALDVRPGDRVLDVCAGPGGKTGHLACLAGSAGMVAADVSTVRLALVRAGLGRLGVSAHLLVQDGRRPAVGGGFDRILVDAPCSGIGSARRRPELLWRGRKDELSGLARLQVGIATAAAGLLAPGGRLVYSVCTFPRAETDAACDALLRRATWIEPLAVEGVDGPAERIRLWPHRHGCDAMFVAAFRRAAGSPD